jgi:hypothetical protein
MKWLAVTICLAIVGRAMMPGAGIGDATAIYAYSWCLPSMRRYNCVSFTGKAILVSQKIFTNNNIIKN